MAGSLCLDGGSLKEIVNGEESHRRSDFDPICRRRLEGEGI